MFAFTGHAAATLVRCLINNVVSLTMDEADREGPVHHWEVDLVRVVRGYTTVPQDTR